METKLSQASIIAIAFDILAEKQDLTKLSMRQLAQKANVQAPALYWYFKNKQQLLQKMAETMENALVIPDPTLDWQEQIIQFMENYYDLYTTFPCGAQLEIHTVPSFPSRLDHLEKMIQVLVQEGFSITQSQQTITALQNLLIGQLMDHQQEQQLRQKISDGDHFLADAVTSMKTYVEEQHLSGLKASILSHNQATDDKQLFLSNVQNYLAGLEKKVLSEGN
ncbi:hypothetical protein A5844_002525 [Enterococcus sp. 10A9_DIV0425]|uniref:HTH tetR-type domain-containing protein n=1 Tax=Candidatus Enterococcus wittei TaxID=1987383 RepID=A0A242JVL6_9ENTE|nr:TetR family transcriptional regulator [Enterococcus sp. 10A9_DIV0425]OTP06851.1 hypothetical protein A5844_002525 [Enterococcus sp. 10A9_DIV0425]THE14333.1 TetR family transcriptional regulator [Enterococcus hirae]